MGDSVKEIKMDSSSMLPDETLVKIFLELSLYEVINLNLVCKRWYFVSRSDPVWEKFLPKYPGIRLPDSDTLQGVFQKLWDNSIKIGKERWFPNALPDLVEHDTALRKEEMKESGKELESKCVLYLRLNPLYPFTTNGLNTKDPAMVEVVQSIFNELGNIDEVDPDDFHGLNIADCFIHDGRSVMLNSCYTNKKDSIDVIVHCLESQNFLVVKKNPSRSYPLFDEEGYRVKNIPSQEQKLAQETEHQSCAEDRLDDKLFHKIRTIIIGTGRHFVLYHLNHGCYEDNYLFPYTRHLVVSDTAAVLCVQYYFDEERDILSVNEQP